MGFSRNNLVTGITVETAPGLNDRPGLSFSYTYDANKNPTAETSGGVMTGYSWTAGHDDEDRLTSWTRNNTDTQTWDLSLVGDWDSTDIGVGGPVQTENRTHDAKGNFTRRSGALDRSFHDFGSR